MSHDLSLSKAAQELVFVIEGRHLNVGMADLPGDVGIAASGCQEPMPAGQLQRAAVVGGEDGAGVEHLQQVHLLEVFNEIGRAHV